MHLGLFLPFFGAFLQSAAKRLLRHGGIVGGEIHMHRLPRMQADKTEHKSRIGFIVVEIAAVGPLCVVAPSDVQPQPHAFLFVQHPHLGLYG